MIIVNEALPLNGTLQLGAVFLLALALIEIIKMLIGRIGNNRNNNKSVLTSEEKRQLQALFDLHQRFDEDGVALWYVPRSWGDTQNAMANILKDILNTQEQIVKILDKMVG